jgi:hypothetical protein
VIKNKKCQNKMTKNNVPNFGGKNVEKTTP